MTTYTALSRYLANAVQMIDVKATNIKLKQRARNILRFVGGDACTQTDEQLDQTLQSCHGSVKLAAVTIVLGVSVEEAEERLERNKGVLARVLEEARQREARRQDDHDGLVLCVDAGGTSCKAVIMSKDGEMGIGTAGPCNLLVIFIHAADDVLLIFPEQMSALTVSYLRFR